MWGLHYIHIILPPLPFLSSEFWWVPLLHSASQHAEGVTSNYPARIVWYLHLNKNPTRSPCRELVRSACSIRVTKHVPPVLIRALITPLGCHKTRTQLRCGPKFISFSHTQQICYRVLLIIHCLKNWGWDTIKLTWMSLQTIKIKH